MRFVIVRWKVFILGTALRCNVESPYADQEDVYRNLGSQLVDNALRGFNSTATAAPHGYGDAVKHVLIGSTHTFI